MKLLLTPAEVTTFAKSMAPITAVVDVDLNKDLKEGEKPSNNTGEMINDIMTLMTSKGIVKEDGPATVSITDKGELCIEIKEEFIQEFTEVYFTHVMLMLHPVKALFEAFKVQQTDMDKLHAKWFPKPKVEDAHSKLFDNLDLDDDDSISDSDFV